MASWIRNPTRAKASMVSIALVVGYGAHDVFRANLDRGLAQDQVIRATSIELVAPGSSDVSAKLLATKEGGMLFLYSAESAIESATRFLALSPTQAFVYSDGRPQFVLNWATGIPIGQLFDGNNQIAWEGAMIPERKANK